MGRRQEAGARRQAAGPHEPGPAPDTATTNGTLRGKKAQRLWGRSIELVIKIN